MKLRSLAMVVSWVAAAVSGQVLIGCEGATVTSSGGTGGSSDAGSSASSGSSGSASSSSGGSASSSSTGTSSSSSTGSTGSSTGSASSGSTGSSSGGQLFPSGTICNDSGTPRTPPATLKHLIVILEENENFNQVAGQPTTPYLNSLMGQCGYASAYDDNCFGHNLVSLPHYLALTSGSNCNTGLDESGTGCITDDNDATAHTLSTTSIFEQVSSWKSYMESMPSGCDESSSGRYAAKHNPAAYYAALASCGSKDVGIAAITCNASNTNTACTTPSNAFTQALANDTLAKFTLISPNLNNDMHDGTKTQADNWLFTYLPLVFQSPAYLRGEVAVFILWDEQATSTFGGATPNLFISPYVTAGTVSPTAMNHFAVLRAWEDALGISTHLGCASGTKPGGGSCPAGSTADVRAALHW